MTTAQVTERVVLLESFRYLEHAPVSIVVVHGDAHSVVYANASFRQLGSLNDGAIVGQPIADVLGNHTAYVCHDPPQSELVALLDRVRNERAQERDGNVSLKVSANVSVAVGAITSVRGSVNPNSETGDHGIWRCRVWPIELRGAWIDQLIIELWHAQEGESSLLRQREIAERMLLSALREQELAADNARLYEDANTARAVAEEEKSRAEEALRAAEAANSAKSQFLANMSHELRTPLNAIAGYAQLIEMGLRGAVTEAQIQDLKRIRRSQSHLLSLITELLDYAKLEGGHVDYDVSDVALGDVLVEAESLVNPQLRAKGLSYHDAQDVELSDVSRRIPVLVRADAEKLMQILVNLLANAIKYTATGGQITVACRAVDRTGVLSVSDTGRGIPADKLQTVFEPFVQIGRTFSSPDAGVGLGLAISRDLAIGMGGSLTVESVQGEGSTFTLVLPLAD